MRCSKLCIILLLIGIGGAVIIATNGNAKVAAFLPFLPLLACPIICVAMMMFGRKCNDDHCDKKHR